MRDTRKYLHSQKIPFFFVIILKFDVSVVIRDLKIEVWPSYRKRQTAVCG